MSKSHKSLHYLSQHIVTHWPSPSTAWTRLRSLHLDSPAVSPSFPYLLVPPKSVPALSSARPSSSNQSPPLNVASPSYAPAQPITFSASQSLAQNDVHATTPTNSYSYLDSHVPALSKVVPPTTHSASQRKNYCFRHGAYGIPKHGHGSSGSGSNKGKPALSTDAAALREKRRAEACLSVQVGEDAYFLRGDSFAVADGVGGWSRRTGADPALFAKKLMHHCSAEMSRYEDVDDPLFLEYDKVDPLDVLNRAYQTSISESKEEDNVGSSTALLAILRNDELRLANVGDCCCMVIRGRDYVFRSEEQQHSFNYPFQVGAVSKDTPLKDGQRFTVKVQQNDIVILGSDGLVDNLFDEDILEEVLRFASFPPSPSPSPSSTPLSFTPLTTRLSRKFSPQAVSEALALRAKAVSEDQRAVTSPFQQKAAEEGIHYVGGKNDDCSVLVALVQEVGDSPDRR